MNCLRKIILVLTIFFFSFFNSTAIAEIMEIENSSLTASIKSQSKADYNLEIKFQEFISATFRPNIFTLKNPSRVVVDLPSVISKTASSDSSSHPLFSGLRLGVHPDKTRIVIDLNDQVGEVEINSKLINESSLSVNLKFNEEDVKFVKNTTSRNNTIKETKTNRPTNSNIPGASLIKLNPQNKPTHQTSSIKEPILKASEEQKNIPSITSEKVTKNQYSNELVIPTTKSQIGSLENKENKYDGPPEDEIITSSVISNSSPTVINGVKYERDSNGKPAIRIDVSNLKNYRVLPKNKNVFELIIDNSKLEDSQLSYPLFPPDDFEGFEVVVPSLSAESVIIKIYLEEGKEPQAFRTSKDLWVGLK